jgi:CheY-like chemotaxis protein/HAMP domain-containing protein
LISRPYQETNLARLYQGLKAAKPGEVLVVDAALFENNVAMFMGTPVFQGDVCLGYLAFQLPLKYLSRRMSSREGMGRTGEIYLVGSDRRMRSDSFNDPVNRTVKVSLSGTVEQNGVDSKGVREALAGKSDKCILTDYLGKKVLSAYAPLTVNGLQWAILAEVDMEEALAPAAALAKITAGLAVAVALLVLALSLLASGRIARPIRSLTDWSRRVTGGDLTLVDIKAPKNEIGVLNESFREAVKSMRAARSEEERRNWQKTGLSELDDRMRGEQDPDVLCRNIVTFIAKYLKARVGAFYLDNGDGVFNLKASYAYKTRKNLSNEFKMGEGLIGQAALEKQSILLTDVPDDYIAISSGLGEKPPKNILVMPLVFNELTLGVIELGSFEAFSEDQRTFLEENGERISIALNSASARQQLQKALGVTQQQAEELETQQEELRAANEELEEQTQALEESEQKLKAQQEELEVANEELREKNEYLEQQKREIEETRKAIEVKAEELEIAGKYKSEFLANMSHELRTPLNSLLLLSSILSENKEGNLTEDQLESTQVIYQSGNDLLSLINEILDLAKIESGKMELQSEEILIKDIADSIAANFQHMIDDKGLRLAINISENAPTDIHTDRKRVEQIIKNLMSNAIKFTEKGGVTVDFSRPGGDVNLSGSELAGQDAIAIAVRDTGIGISPEDQKIIFEAFQQVEGGTARQYGGTGLGLSISRELARLFGGEIHLISEKGKGSTFTLYLPIKAEKKRSSEIGDRKRGPEDSSAFRAPHSAFESSLRGVGPYGPEAELRTPSSIEDDRDSLSKDEKAILVIEDDPKFARLLLKLCHERGLKCLATPFGEEGLELAEKYLPEAIILDIKLPGIDGWTVLETLKESPKIRHIPVHIMSVEEPTMEAFRKGAIGYLMKPVKKEDLEAAFHKLDEVSSKEVKTLLVVEDDENLRKSIIKLIGNGDVCSEEAANGEETIRALKSKTFDCMIMDLGLPDMTGFQLLKALEAEEGVTIPPVIVYTGRELTREEDAQLREYAESIIIKGVKSEERLLDEASLFLHRVVSKMPEKKRQMITSLHDTDVMFKDKTVLVVDDDMRNVFALSRVLEERGMRVLKAENGQKALKVLKDTPEVDLVLMDIMMPVMDGYETMKRIRAQETFRKLPVIALTAKAMKEDKMRCIAAGASDYLTKPVDVNRLISMMRVWLYR